jgi:hypothetical protein
MATATGVPDPAESAPGVVCTVPPSAPGNHGSALEPWPGVEGFDRHRPDKMSSAALDEPPPSVADAIGQPGRQNPEWHALRLFGRGRHRGAFESGNERDRDL